MKTKNFLILLSVTLSLFALILFGCKKEKPEVPVLTTSRCN